jgi:protein-S-isoprenylcysteine O-methyltransferase Ste14
LFMESESMTHWEEEKKKVLRHINHFRAYLVAMPVLFSFVCLYRETETDDIVWPVGLFLILLGFGIRTWSEQHIHRRLSLPRHLTTTGPYRIIRNPLYVGNMILVVGATLLSELIWLIPISFLWTFSVYSIIVRYEEGRLVQRFEESYREYLLRTPRWIPRIPIFRPNGLTTSYLGASLKVELSCLLLILPYVLKELLS